MKLKVTYDPKLLLSNTKKEIALELPSIADKIIEELRVKTPKDTGEASRSWEHAVTSYNQFVVSNDEDYIKYLNAGSSKQAPANFIEQVVLNYGTAKGNVVEYDS